MLYRSDISKEHNTNATKSEETKCGVFFMIECIFYKEEMFH